jgi:hypothetical protein
MIDDRLLFFGCEGRTCNKIQIPAQKPATGQAIKNKRRSHRIAKMGFLFMVTDGLEQGRSSKVFLDWNLWEEIVASGEIHRL